VNDLRTALSGVVDPAGILTSAEDLIAYGFDGTFYQNTPPLVVLPTTTAQVVAIHEFAHARRLAITPRAMGSGLSGGAIPLAGSIVLGVARMNRIIEIDEINHVAVVQPGVINAHLQSEVEKRGLFYPPDPSSLKQSAIGGNVAENAGGARCLIRTGGKMVKNVTGYNLRALFTGSEGTLGTITEVTLKLIAKPKFARTAVAVFDRIADAATCVTAIMATGIVPTSIEMLDNLTMRCVEAAKPIGLPLDADAILIFGADGNYEEIVNAEVATIATIAREQGARDVTVAQNAEESERLWNARRSISPALAQQRPNKLGEDIAIPRSAIPRMVERCREISVKYNVPVPVYGHVGDGNLHPNILCDKTDKEEMLRVRDAAREIFETAIELGGTLSGEHGIGMLKKQFMELDLGIDALELMRKIKNAIDPLGIMNPGKIFPEPGGADAFTL